MLLIKMPKNFRENQSMTIDKQLNIKDCGLYVLQAFGQLFYKRKCDINFLKEKATYDACGISLSSFEKLGNLIGLECEILEDDFLAFLKIKDLKNVATILNIEGFLHYVIISKKEADTFEILDSARGKYYLSKEELKEKYLNFIIKVKKIPNFEINFPKQNYQLKTNINPMYLILFVILNTTVNCLTFSSSFYLKYIFDAIFDFGAKNRVIVIFIIFLWILILKTLTAFFARFINKKITLIYEQNLNIEAFNSLNNSEQIQLDKIDKKDFHQQLILISSVAKYKATFMIFLLNNIIAVLAAFCLLIVLNYLVLLITLTGSLIIFSISIFSNAILAKKYYKLMQYQTSWFESLNNSFNDYKCRKDIFYNVYNSHKFFASLKDIKDSTNHLWTVNETNNNINLFIFDFTQLIIVFSTALLYLQKQFNIGNILLLSSVSIFLNNPILNMANLISERKINKANIIKLKFLLNLKSEHRGKYLFKVPIQSIEFRKATFSYGSSKIIKNFSALIKNSLIIKGKNGTGKSTLFKLIYHLYSPQTGNILINNIPMNLINLEAFRKHIFINNLNAHFPEDTVINLITFNDKNAAFYFQNNYYKFELWKILKLANLDLNFRVINNGENLSAGQKQILILLRLFARDYKLILFDEAFENISQEIFEIFQQKIQQYTKSKILLEISHSLRYINPNNDILTVF
ncbi:Mbov_0121 family peptidase domain-containing ABC transporter [Metamycoplasma neophronis]|uniref:ATP-binding cassette domain-containing protein n=1 Tax=Metamycoplasma neophronis TaxID=872983 RepID=A0ABY2Z0R6_9BACT|nr:ATP-binding cassette domain-containing protein [Metamycoplasma neophronis]TPR53881.1 ATP-binding cassette domain-containing protein [Metamycoplasma neophronis]